MVDTELQLLLPSDLFGDLYASASADGIPIGRLVLRVLEDWQWRHNNRMRVSAAIAANAAKVGVGDFRGKGA